MSYKYSVNDKLIVEDFDRIPFDMRGREVYVTEHRGNEDHQFYAVSETPNGVTLWASEERDFSPATKVPATDMIKHPAHYNEGPAHRICGEPIECIEITQTMNFNRGNAVKYLWRAGKKHNEIEDLKKAKQYIEFEIKRLEDLQ